MGEKFSKTPKKKPANKQTNKQTKHHQQLQKYIAEQPVEPCRFLLFIKSYKTHLIALLKTFQLRHFETYGHVW